MKKIAALAALSSQGDEQYIGEPDTANATLHAVLQLHVIIHTW
jgi:hypothetical protein